MSDRYKSCVSQSTPSVQECARKYFPSASDYEEVRQDYPIEAAEFLLQNLGVLDNNAASTCRPTQRKVLELGSGTGKFTRVMLEVLKEQNVRVIASDPLEHMCEQFRLLLPGTEIMQCSAENITLPDASVDFVIASQSFHWFANSTALEEIHRVLVPDGSFGIIWAIPDYSIPWMAKLWKFLLPLFKEKSVSLPPDEKWKNVFSLTSRKLFSDLEENLNFRLQFPSSFDEADKFFASFSVLVSGSEKTRESFKELFNKVMRQDFKDEGITLDHVPFQIYLYWCNKLS